MILNPKFELSMTRNTEHFQRVFTTKAGCLKELDEEYIDPALVAKGITIIYRDSRYKKKVRVLINTSAVVDNPSDTDKLLHKLDKRIGEYFNHRYALDDFALSGVTLTVDINVGSHTNVSDYLKVISWASHAPADTA